MRLPHRAGLVLGARLLAVATVAAAGTAGAVGPAAARAAAPITLTVAKTGAQYTSVQAAVNAVPDNSPTPYVISIAKGTYAETVTIPASKPHLSLVGATGNPADVVITAAHYHQETDPATGLPYGTEGSATVHAQASDFTAEYLTIANTFDKTQYPNVTGTQAVAVAMEGDRQQYLHDDFYGHQDTLLTWGSSAGTDLRQYVYASTIEGDVDFIFGNGDLVVDRSTIDALNDGVYASAYLTAPATPAGQAHGILITGSTVNTTLADNTLALGRAWKPAADSDPQVVIRDTVLPQAVDGAAPWLGISGATWSAGRYGEYANTGPGSTTSSTASRPQLTATAAASYTATGALAGSDGWNPVVPGADVPPRTLLGDRRNVAEPRTPGGICATVTAGLPGGTRTFDPADEATPPDTDRIQAALDACTGTGEQVRLTGHGADTALLSAPLTVHGGEHLALDSDVTLYATRVAAQYQQSGKATCGSIGASGTGCAPFITVRGRNAGIDSSLRHGRQGTIDGRGDLPILGTSASWWDQATTAKAQGLKQVNPRLVQAGQSDGFTVHDLTLVDAAKQHLFITQSIGVTVWGLRIDTPAYALNTDGVDVDSSTEATVADSWLNEGDDCVALTTNNAAESAVTIRNLHCYGTHGPSIGSGTTYGLDSVLFVGNTLQGTDRSGIASTLDNGIRVKSYPGAGGTVSNVTYADTCMTGVQYLIDIDPNYAAPTGTSIPLFQSVTVDGARAWHSLPGAQSVLDGYDSAHVSGITLRDVDFDATTVQAQYAAITLAGTDLAPTGTDVTTSVVAPSHGSGDGHEPCSFPAFPTAPGSGMR
ncbi:pectin methylesterase-like acyl-CoA thioesterase [Streptacidiphilus sp. BW17]|uniref:pectinesterase family protein n=1 Tax=Streptacidiphilus sp. BW17 TaxID=3156274 RepID=UPI003513D4EC